MINRVILKKSGWAPFVNKNFFIIAIMYVEKFVHHESGGSDTQLHGIILRKVRQLVSSYIRTLSAFYRSELAVNCTAAGSTKPRKFDVTFPQFRFVP